MKKERKMIKDYTMDSQYPLVETGDSFSSGPQRQLDPENEPEI